MRFRGIYCVVCNAWCVGYEKTIRDVGEAHGEPDAFADSPAQEAVEMRHPACGGAEHAHIRCAIPAGDGQNLVAVRSQQVQFTHDSFPPSIPGVANRAAESISNPGSNVDPIGPPSCTRAED